MDFNISNGASVGGDRFKADDHKGAFLIMFEPKGVRTGIATQFGSADSTDTDVTVFLTEAELKQGKPSTILTNAGIMGALGKSLQGNVNGIVIGKLGQKDTGKGRPAWIIEPADPRLTGQVKDYLVAREEARQADLPDFMRD